MHDALGSQLTLSATIVFLIQLLKSAKWFPWLRAHTDRLNRIVALGLSGVAAIGIHTAYDASLDGGTLVISGIGIAAIAHGLWEWLQSYALQEFVYRAGVKSVPAQEVAPPTD